MTDFAAYVFYVNRPDLLARSVCSFPELSDDLTIVDNSAVNVPSTVFGKAFKPPVPLSYTQSMNWMLKDATERGKDFIIHFHSDATSSNSKAVLELLDYCRRMKAEGRRWGCLWTFYDILWAVNPLAMNDIGGWDTNFKDYFCDQDVRRRLNLAGWETIDTNIQGINHEGSATINSDPKLQFLNGQTFPLYSDYYAKKWGGAPGHERYQVPFNHPTLFA